MAIYTIDEEKGAEQFIVVLNDGETYTSLEGCKLIAVTKSGCKKLDEGQEPNDLNDKDISMNIPISELFSFYSNELF